MCTCNGSAQNFTQETVWGQYCIYQMIGGIHQYGANWRVWHPQLYTQQLRNYQISSAIYTTLPPFTHFITPLHTCSTYLFSFQTSCTSRLKRRKNALFLHLIFYCVLTVLRISDYKLLIVLPTPLCCEFLTVIKARFPGDL